MEEQYGMADLCRQYMNGRPHFPAPGDLFSGERNLTQPQQQYFEMLMLGRSHQNQMGADVVPQGLHHRDFRSDSTSATTASLDEAGGGGPSGDGGSAGRWPRQETLTLLEIRSRLDSKFKEANQKGPLWDEVSRIMYEEHGYQRSGKKCREKFENLYKYYKKTKEGKAGRQDGKHYRFFRQLEALYGTDTATTTHQTHLMGNTSQFQTTSNFAVQGNTDPFPAQKLSDSLSLSNSNELDASSSSDEGSTEKKRSGRRRWKAKVKEMIEVKMRMVMEKQEEWWEKMMKTLEEKEQERVLREEEWRREEMARIEREHKLWTRERAWIEARDAALMNALKKITGRELKALCSEESEIRSLSENQNENGSDIFTNTLKTAHGLKQIQNNESLYSHGGSSYCNVNEHGMECTATRLEEANCGAAPATSNGLQYSFYKLLVGNGGDNLWDNCGVKLRNGES
ncbi:hypothetical protein NMG60_11001410 [Bertholletia excelsa]